jgi:hypothetical protein
MPTPALNRRFYPTPGWLVVLSLATTGILFLSERYQWFPFNLHKGWTVLIAVAAVGVVLVVMFFWWIVALVFRLRFQFGIRMLLVLTLAVALPFSWLAVEMKRATDQRKLAEEIGKRHGAVVYDLDYLTRAQGSVNGSLKRIPWLWSVLGEEFFDVIGHVGFYGSQVTDMDLNYCISQLPRLRSLSLFETSHITDASLERIKALGDLQWLYLNTWTVTDAGLTHVAEMIQLEDLNLGGAKVTNAGLNCLKTLPQLHTLSLHDTEITDDGLRILEGFSQLRILDLRNNEITDDAVKKLQQSLPDCKICH